MELKTNKERLAVLAVQGEIIHPVISGYRHYQNGTMLIVPGTGGITYNVKVGDPVNFHEGDHLEPGVTLKSSREVESMPLNVLSCIGNTATVITGNAKGKAGIVTGKHSGVEHVLIDFADEILDKLVIGDKILVKAVGVGLKLDKFPGIHIFNSSPELIEKIPLKVSENKISCPVAAIIPSAIMGSGLGTDMSYKGDYDIQMFDPMANEKYGLNNLKLGDLVAITDTDHTYGRSYKQGFLAIGVIIHAKCGSAGHGPGVTTIATAKNDLLVPYLDKNANIGKYLQIGRYRNSKSNKGNKSSRRK